MNRYLTPKAQRRFGVWALVIIALLVFLDISLISNAFDDYQNYRHSWFFLNITHYLLDYYPSISPVVIDCVAIGVVTLLLFGFVRSSIRKHKAKIVSERLMAQKKTQVLLLLADNELKMRNSEKKIARLLKQKYLQGVSIDEKYIHLT